MKRLAAHLPIAPLSESIRSLKPTWSSELPAGSDPAKPYASIWSSVSEERPPGVPTARMTMVTATARKKSPMMRTNISMV